MLAQISSPDSKQSPFIVEKNSFSSKNRLKSSRRSTAEQKVGPSSALSLLFSITKKEVANVWEAQRYQRYPAESCSQLLAAQGRAWGWHSTEPRCSLGTTAQCSVGCRQPWAQCSVPSPALCLATIICQGLSHEKTSLCNLDSCRRKDKPFFVVIICNKVSHCIMNETMAGLFGMERWQQGARGRLSIINCVYLGEVGYGRIRGRRR